MLSFGLVANLVALMTFAATLNKIAADWSLDASQSGWIGGIYFAGYAISVPFLASASDRMDARSLYVGSASLGAAASLAFALFAQGFVLPGPARDGTHVGASYFFRCAIPGGR